MPTPARAAQGDVFVPRPEVARASALGFDAVLADYYWLQAVQIVGSATVARARRADLLGALIDVVTTLDPWVDHPYRFAAVWLTDSEDDVRKANELLAAASTHHPHDWRNRFYLGFNHFFYLDERVRGGATRSKAAIALPGAPLYLRRLVARLKSDRGRPRRRRGFLHGLLLRGADRRRSAQPSTRRRSTRSRPSASRASSTPRASATASATAATSRRVEELVRGPGAGAARAPAGAPRRRLDARARDAGEIVSDVVGHRYEPKIDP